MTARRTLSAPIRGSILAVTVMFLLLNICVDARVSPSQCGFTVDISHNEVGHCFRKNACYRYGVPCSVVLGCTEEEVVAGATRRKLGCWSGTAESCYEFMRDPLMAGTYIDGMCCEEDNCNYGS